MHAASQTEGLPFVQIRSASLGPAMEDRLPSLGSEAVPPTLDLAGSCPAVVPDTLAPESEPLSLAAFDSSPDAALMSADWQPSVIPDTLMPESDPPCTASPLPAGQSVAARPPAASMAAVPDTLLPWSEPPDMTQHRPANGASEAAARLLQPSIVLETLVPWSQPLSAHCYGTAAERDPQLQPIVPETLLPWSQPSLRDSHGTDDRRGAGLGAGVAETWAPCWPPQRSAPSSPAAAPAAVPGTLASCELAEESEVPASPPNPAPPCPAPEAPATATALAAWGPTTVTQTQGQPGSELSHWLAVPRDQIADLAAERAPLVSTVAARAVGTVCPGSSDPPGDPDAGASLVPLVGDSALSALPLVVPETQDVPTDELAEDEYRWRSLIAADTMPIAARAAVLAFSSADARTHQLWLGTPAETALEGGESPASGVPGPAARPAVVRSPLSATPGPLGHAPAEQMMAASESGWRHGLAMGANAAMSASAAELATRPQANQDNVLLSGVKGAAGTALRTRQRASVVDDAADDQPLSEPS